jgi:starch phosphorylase
MQYALLGVGGVRALSAMNIRPAVFHLNEGHAAMVALALAGEEVARGRSVTQAIENARSRIVFTTHTPVAAGNESYSTSAIKGILGTLPAELGIDLNVLLELGRGIGSDGEKRFGMTELALRGSRSDHLRHQWGTRRLLDRRSAPRIAFAAHGARLGAQRGRSAALGCDRRNSR